MAAPMTKSTQKAYLRGFELRDSGSTWNQIEEQLAREGYTTDTKKRILKGAVSMQYSRAKLGKSPLKTYFQDRPATVPTEAPQNAIQENTDVLQTDETPVSVETTPESIHEDTREYAPCKTQDADVLQLDSVTRAALLEMLSWWTENRGKMQAQNVEPRTEAPNFGPKGGAPKTIRLSEKMIRAAEQYAKQHRSLTGGTFSGLVELAIWRLLGEPEELVLREDTE